jgi:hypothetical protein
MKTWRVTGLLAVVLSLSWAAPASSQTLGLYDDFSAATFDPVRWAGYEYTIGPSDAVLRLGEHDWSGLVDSRPINGASLRRLAGGQARIALTTAEGPGGKARSLLRINHPALADIEERPRILRATVTVASVSVPGQIAGACEPTRFGRASAQIFGHFANDFVGERPATDFTGDIFAALGLERRVEWSRFGGGRVRNVFAITIGRCSNVDCTRVNFYGPTRVLSREWVAGVPYVLTIKWATTPTSAFTFTVTGDGRSESHIEDYIRDAGGAPLAYAYDLRVETQPVSCGAAADGVTAPVSIDARFDNVYLNRRAADATQ